jgi:moderate conductance mechanosensitive channel
MKPAQAPGRPLDHIPAPSYNPRVPGFTETTDPPLRLLLILAAAVLAHASVRIIRASGVIVGRSRIGSLNKTQTISRFIASVAVFVIWFAAVGFALTTLGVPLQTYIASATIIGLAVSFGSQSLVQDVISGVTLITTGLVEVGDMIDAGGQIGVVEKIGIRYTEMRNVQGAIVFIPNRNVGNVISYPVGYIRAFVDAQLPGEPSLRPAAAECVKQVADGAFRQFSGIMIREPSVMTIGGAPSEPMPGDEDAPQPPPEQATYVRVKFRIWPGQGAVIESAVRLRVINALKRVDPEYQDWMVAVHYRVEPAFQRRALPALDELRRRRRKR